MSLLSLSFRYPKSTRPPKAEKGYLYNLDYNINPDLILQDKLIDAFVWVTELSDIVTGLTPKGEIILRYNRTDTHIDAVEDGERDEGERTGYYGHFAPTEHRYQTNLGVSLQRNLKDLVKIGLLGGEADNGFMLLNKRGQVFIVERHPFSIEKLNMEKIKSFYPTYQGYGVGEYVLITTKNEAYMLSRFEDSEINRPNYLEYETNVHDIYLRKLPYRDVIGVVDHNLITKNEIIRIPQEILDINQPVRKPFRTDRLIGDILVSGDGYFDIRGYPVFQSNKLIDAETYDNHITLELSGEEYLYYDGITDVEKTFPKDEKVRLIHTWGGHSGYIMKSKKT